MGYNDDAMDRETFEILVDEAVDSLPDDIKAWLDNVAIVVADQPTPDQLEGLGLRPGDLLLGRYVGVPKTHRGITYGETLPDKIVIFQRNVERFCRSPRECREQVRKTVLHEIGHHFGLADAELRDAGV